MKYGGFTIELFHQAGKLTSILKSINDQERDNEFTELKQGIIGLLAEVMFNMVDGTCDEGKQYKTEYLYSLAHPFSHYPTVLSCYLEWCLEIEQPNSVIRFFHDHRSKEPLPCRVYLHMAQAQIAHSDEDKERCLQAAYKEQPCGPTAYNLGCFYIIQSEAPDLERAIEYFYIATRPPLLFAIHFFGLWACQAALGLRDEAYATLAQLRCIEHEQLPDAQQLNERILECERSLATEEVISLERAIKICNLQYNPPLIPRRILRPQTHPLIQAWIDQTSIPLPDGYIGIPIQQRNTDRMPPKLVPHYRSQLEKKLPHGASMTFPMPPLDCWIGVKGKNRIPRVDIERYESAGNAHHFQKLCFQCGTKGSYGGLWLSGGPHPMPGHIIQAAYEEWIKSESPYLLVFHPDHYLENLADIHREIYGIDELNRIKSKEPSSKKR